MKKSKWLFPILIITIFCIIMFIGNNLVMKQVHEIRKRIKENKIEAEKQQAYVQEEKFENNTSPIKNIQAGNSYTAILKEDGTVWVTGINSSYTSDYIYEGIQNNQFTKVKIENVKQIEVGDEFVIALNEKGEVYSWGGNSYSMLGIDGASSKPYQVPRKVPIENIEKIYVFGKQVAALSKDQIAYYWGYAVENYDSKVPNKLEEKVKEIYLIQHQYYFKTVNDEIYAVGFDFGGVTAQVNGWARNPIKLNLQNVKKIVSYEGYENSTSQNNKYIIKNDGTVWKLDTIGNTLETKIQGLQAIENIYPYKSMEYSRKEPSFLAIDKNGNIYKNNSSDKIEKLDIQGVKDIFIKEEMVILLKKDGSLWNLERSVETLKGNLESYVPTYCSEPKKIDVKNIKLVAMSSKFMLVVDQNDNIYRQGSNSKGQLGAGNQAKCSDLTFVQKIQNNLENEEKILIDPSMETMAD